MTTENEQPAAKADCQDENCVLFGLVHTHVYLEQAERTEEQYLGDGVYASFDGWQIWLAANDHLNEVIAIEPQVWAQLVKYASRVWGQRQAPNLPAASAIACTDGEEPIRFDQDGGRDEPPDPDGEEFRGGEAAAYNAQEQDRIQRELKR